MPKNIVVYSDGTGQDGGVRPEQRISNVYKMYRASRTSPDNPIDPKVQVAFYDPGLGTDVGATALSAPRRFIQKMLGSITGRGIVTNIADCYAFIIDHYEPGDRIYLIGFSRGAYTVRSLANLLMLCGVPTGTPSGPLMRFRRQVRDIAMEAVTVVLEHGAGHPRAEYAAEREEQARRFRQKYASDGPVNSNAAPYFIGVFDTVAALGARGALRLGISAALLAAVLATAAAAGAIPSAAVALIFHWSLGWGFWTVWTLLILLSVAGGGLWYTRAQKQAQLKTITDYPNKGDSPRSHYAEWKGDNFDRLLSAYVRYGRAANAIDESRKDFQRVGWGPSTADQPVNDGGPAKLVQLWFAGNHSDIGGSYTETESRLSDNALGWMLEQATSVPDGIKVGPVYVDDMKMPGTGETGTPLHIYPRSNGVQHCELAGMRDSIDGLVDSLPRWMRLTRRLLGGLAWPEEKRSIPHDAVVHDSVRERFALDRVPQCAGDGPYRPEALRAHDEFAKYYTPRGELAATTR
jgi:uncharacterized protein (DUF2235 family)